MKAERVFDSLMYSKHLYSCGLGAVLVPKSLINKIL